MPAEISSSFITVLLSLAAISVGAEACTRSGLEPPKTASTDLGRSVEFELSTTMPAQVYSSESGIKVQIAFLEETADEPNRALVRYSGVLGPGTGVVFLATDRSQGRGQFWKINFDGRERGILSIQFSGGNGSNALRVNLTVPRARAGVGLRFDKEATKALDLAEFIATHKHQRANGKLAELAKINRAYHEKGIRRSMERARQMLTNTCKTEIPLTLEWASLSDDQLRAGEYCGQELDQLAKTCRRDVLSRENIQKGIKNISCSGSTANGLSLSEQGTLAISVHYDVSRSNQDIYSRLTAMFSRAKLVLTDSRHRILVFDPDNLDGRAGDARVYLGNRDTLYRLRHTEGENSIWDPNPNAYYRGVSFTREDAGWLVRCKTTTIHFVPVAGPLGEALLKTAARNEPRWKREPHALARDNRGIYYYVDKYAGEFGGKHYRVFRGPRGQMRQTALVDIVEDSNGMIFATKGGDLRLLIGNDNQQVAQWIRGKHSTKLSPLPVSKNRVLIYGGLGIYDNVELGTVCE